MPAKKNIIINKLKDFIKNLESSIPISQAYLFGSYANGKPTKWSDIDVAVISPKFKGIRFYDIKKIIPYLRGYPNLIEVHPFNNKDFKKENLFVKQILKGIRIK